MADICSNCRFGARIARVDDRPAPKHIICRRYPTAVEKNAADWCGEFVGEFVSVVAPATKK